MSSLPSLAFTEPKPAPGTCPECLGTGEYAYHADPTGRRCPYHGCRVATGWHDGWWWKQCWHCHGSGFDPNARNHG